MSDGHSDGKSVDVAAGQMVKIEILIRRGAQIVMHTELALRPELVSRLLDGLNRMVADLPGEKKLDFSRENGGEGTNKVVITLLNKKLDPALPSFSELFRETGGSTNENKPD
jgi:hypothetical protein